MHDDILTRSLHYAIQRKLQTATPRHLSMIFVLSRIFLMLQIPVLTKHDGHKRGRQHANTFCIGTFQLS